MKTFPSTFTPEAGMLCDEREVKCVERAEEGQQNTHQSGCLPWRAAAVLLPLGIFVNRLNHGSSKIEL